MKKIHFLLLISLLLAACSDDDKEKQPAFVTNITISDAGKTFNPGDAVTVKADGLQSGDQIILDIYWPIADNPLFPEGYSRYTRAVTTEQTTNSITFLAPGHWPASRVEMFLERAGQLQPLGQISVADGQSPEEPYLYGITNSHAIYTPTVPRGITRIDLVTQEISEVIQFHDDEDFHLAANIPGTNILCGIREKDGSSFIDGYDLCMHYWCNPVERNAITICSDFNNTVSLEMAGDKLLTYCSISYPVYTRLNMPPIHTPITGWTEARIPLTLSGRDSRRPHAALGQQRRRHLLARRDRHRQRKDALLRPHQGRSLDTFPDYGTIPRKPKQPAMQRRLYRFPCQWWRYAILLMGYYCRKLERVFRHLPQRRTLRYHVLLQGRADKETLRAVCRLS